MRFEDLVTGPERTVRTLMDWLGLDYSPDLLEVPMASSSHHPDRWDVRGIDKRTVDRWRQGCLDPSEIYLCERLLATEMARLGYSPLAQRPQIVRMGFHLLSWIPRTGVAWLLNSVRTRRPLVALRRRIWSEAK